MGEDDDMREERRDTLRHSISQILAAAVEQGGGYLSKEACEEILNSPYQVRRLRRAGVTQSVTDIKRILDWLDVDRTSTIKTTEFCESLDWLTEPVTGRLLLKVDSGLK